MTEQKIKRSTRPSRRSERRIAPHESGGGGGDDDDDSNRLSVRPLPLAWQAAVVNVR